MPDTDPNANPQTPPWGKDEDFDAARAWSLIQNLRNEVIEWKGKHGDVSTKLTAAEKAVSEKETANQTEAQRLEARLQAAEDRANKAARDVLVSKAQQKHSLSDDVLEFLTGDTEEEIEAKASRLAVLGSGNGQGPADTANPLASRPRPKLTPGQGDSQTPAPASAADLDALAAYGSSRRR